MEMTQVCDGLEFPEGPVALADGAVVVVEVKGQRLTRISPDGRKAVLARTGGGADMRDAWIAGSGAGRLYKTRWPRPGLRLNFNA